MRVHSTITAAGYRIRGTYAGGPYVDLSFEGDAVPFEAVSVWNYATDRPTIGATARDVRRVMAEWCAAAGDQLAHDLAEYDRLAAPYREERA